MSRATADAALSTERHEQPHPRRNPPSPLNPDCRCQRQSTATIRNAVSGRTKTSCQRQSEATIIIAKRGRRLHADRRSHLIQIVVLQAVAVALRQSLIELAAARLAGEG